MKIGKAISVRLKALREAAGLSQQDVAMKADLSLSLVAKLEQGKKGDPRASTLIALAEALDMRPGQLLDELMPVGSDSDLPEEHEEHEEHEDGVNGVANSNGEEGEKKSKKKKKKSKKKG